MLKEFLRSFVLGTVVVIGISGTASAETMQLTLEDSIQMALAKDGTIQDAEAADEAARWSLSAARRSAGPSLQWNSSALSNGGRDYRNAPNMDSTYGNTVGLQIPLYTGGRIEGNIKRYGYELNFVNIADYAYDEGGKVVIRGRLLANPSAIELSFIDEGYPYNPLTKSDPDFTIPLQQRREGGLGVFLIRKYVEDVSYKWQDGRNILTIYKKIT